LHLSKRPSAICAEYAAQILACQLPADNENAAAAAVTIIDFV